jgi:shikimate 5-dehydrogenase
MLVEQAALAFERWFEIPAPRQAMADAALSALERLSLAPERK